MLGTIQLPEGFGEETKVTSYCFKGEIISEDYGLKNRRVHHHIDLGEQATIHIFFTFSTGEIVKPVHITVFTHFFGLKR